MGWKWPCHEETSFIKSLPELFMKKAIIYQKAIEFTRKNRLYLESEVFEDRKEDAITFPETSTWVD